MWFDSENRSDVLATVLPLKGGMDPANLLHLRTAPSENGPKPVENSNDNLLDMVCESPLAGKVKFMCSFGGKILPRPSDGKLRYVGGETRLISINRNFSWKELMQKTLTIYSQPHIIKYQLPDEDLDALISLSCDEDYQNMMEEYDSLEKANGSVRLRIFLVSLTESEDPSLDSKSLESEPEYNFVVAVNNLAKLDRSISGNNLMSQSNHQLDSSPALYGDSLLCQTNTETGSQDPVGAAHNESSQFFLAPYTQQMVAESSTTSSPSLGQQRTVQQSRMQPPANESTVNQEHVNRSDICYGSNLKAMPPGHLNKKQNDADKSVGTGSPMQHLYIQRQAHDARLSSNDLDALESSVPKPMHGPMDYGIKGYAHENDKVASESLSLLPINTSEVFALQRSMVNGESSVYENAMDGIPRREDPLSDLGNIACTEGVTVFDDTIINNGSMKLPPRMHDNAQMKVPVLVEDVTHNVPSGIPSSSSVVPRIVVAAEERQEVIMSSLKDDDTMSNGPEFANEDHDDGAVDGAVSDAAVAELEASMYGLQQHVIDIDNQIIKNGDLEELRELGSGTFGTVYYGKWRGTDVAIKRIKKSCFAGRLSEQEKLTSDFWREAQILSKLHHPNVVAFYGVVPDGTGGTLATVTEFMVNGSLRNVLLRKDRMLDRRRKLTIAMDAAFGMEYLHSRSIVHFDLKCDNLLVNLRDPQRPICKVGDFGLSRIKRNTLVSGGVRGTLPWMAPELLNGSSSKVSEKVDVFSFGIVLWEILTGEEPYANMHCGAIIGSN
nr:unnamed protein product [Digitaria exilis]